MNIGKLEPYLLKIGVFGGGALFSLFGDFNAPFKILVYFMVVDYFVGFSLSAFGYSKKSENGHIESKQIFKGIAKKIVILILVSVSMQIGKLMNFEGLRDLVIFGFIAFEFTSLLEHVAVLGIKMPKALIDMLEVMNEKEQKGIDNDGL